MQSCKDIKSATEIPESEHVAGNVGVTVVKVTITHSSPDTTVVDLQTSCSLMLSSIFTGKSNFSYYYTSTHYDNVNRVLLNVCLHVNCVSSIRIKLVTVQTVNIVQLICQWLLVE